MSTITLDRPTIQTETAPAPAPTMPLTVAEQDAMLTMSATLDKPKRVNGGKGSTKNSPRAWSRGGMVD